MREDNCPRRSQPLVKEDILDTQTLSGIVVEVIRTGILPESREDKTWDGFLNAISDGDTPEHRLELFKELGKGLLASSYDAIVDSIQEESTIIPRSIKMQLNSLPRTDAGNAEAFVLLYGDIVRYDHEKGLWMLFGEGLWKEVMDGAISRLALQTIRYRRAAAEIEDGDKRQAIIRFAISSESCHRISGMLRMVRDMRPVAEEGGNWNSIKHLIGTPNGVIDLRSGKRIEGQPHHAVTLRTNSSVFYPEINCPTWLSFLDDIFGGDQELIDYVQLALGYSLTGETNEQVLIAAIGGGANGKSTFINAVTYALGEYARWTDMSTFYHQYGGGPRNDLASLRYARLVAASEYSSSQVLDEGIIKRLTGQDKISCRHLWQSLFEYYPQFCIWVLLNVLPRTKDASHAFWRRIHTVPFSKVFTGDEIDTHMGVKLRKEAQGILSWIVEGAVRYYRGERLQETSAMLEVKNAWQRQSDHFRLYMEEMIKLDPQDSISAVEFRKNYHEWCGQDIAPLPRNTIGRRLAGAYNIEISHDAAGRAVYRGIGFIEY